jgi:hypothetical protein
MFNPKQRLTSFSRVYQAKYALSQMAFGANAAESAFGGVAAEFARQDALHETDAAVLSQLARTQSITTIEELAALARLDATQKTSFITDLGLPTDLAARIIDQLRKVRPAALADIERFEKLEYTLGYDIDFSSPPPTTNPFQPAVVGGVIFGAPPPPTGQPPPTVVNLIDSNMPPIREQADRGACVVFASLACLEYHLNRFGNQTGLDLSEQFHYWNMVTTTQHRRLVSAYPLLASAGSCREITWPYYGKDMPGNDSQGPAPASAAAEAMAYRCNQVRRVPARDISAIQAELRRGRMVAIGIPVYKSWYNSGTVRQYGNITVPIAGEVNDGGHAIALVGYADDPDYAGGGYFIVRNSWDSRWGTQSVFGSGYGTIPYLFISDHNRDAWCIVS